MADNQKITDGANERAIDEPLASSAAGIPDDALAPGEELFTPPSDEEVSRIARNLGVPIPETKS